MGCCASTTSTKPFPDSHVQRHSSAARSGASSQSRAPPPSYFEEETVKEVLSETPNRKSSVPRIEEAEKKQTNKWVFRKVNEGEDNVVDKKPLTANIEETSDISEICSLNESVSTATAAERRGDDEDGEVRQRVDRSPAKNRNRSFSGEMSARRERLVGGKSPARRGEPSPGRVRMVPGRERRGLVTDGQRRDVGDKSGRRSRSPGTRTDGSGPKAGLGRSPSSRRSGRSPGRVPSEVAEKNRKAEENNREEKWPPTTNESLENPLVSLECFIFL